VDSGERVIVGLNKYGMPAENDLEDQKIFEIDDRVEGSQKQKLAGIRADRNADDVQKQLAGLANAIDKNENLMPHIIEAVKSYATIGEICGVMREKWGEFQASTYI
jgi:methylmalonyl-CoA mutase N-terminal domain/subunit